jgi:putative membrane protein
MVMARWVIAAVHLLMLPIGFTAIWGRTRALRGTLDLAGLRRVFLADNLWGAAGIVWVASGLARAFGGLEKGSAYYLSHPVFYLKMGLVGIILALEVWPTITLVRWRMATRRGQRVDTQPAPAIARISSLQALLVLLSALAATALARGIQP